MNPFVAGALAVLKMLASDQKVINAILELVKELAARSSNKIDDGIVDAVGTILREGMK